MNKALVILLLTMTFFGVLSCSTKLANQPSLTAANSSPTVSLAPIPAAFQFGLKRVIWNADSLHIFGTADVADSARLNTQLYKDNQPAEWWPGALRAYIEGDKWELGVRALEWNIPSPFPNFESGYSFRISDPVKPEIGATFDLPFPGPEFTPISDLKDSQWQLISLNDKKPISGSNVTMSFDVQNKGRIWGNAGVNFYGSIYETDAPDKVIFYDSNWTAMLGPDNLMQQEKVYLKALKNAAFFKIVDTHLEIYDDIHVRSLVFERTP